MLSHRRRVLNGFGSPEAGRLVVAVARVDAAPAIDDDVGTERADDADHVFEDLVAPDFFRFGGRFGVAKIFGACEIEFHAVAARGGQQFLRADQAELGSLFGAKGVLSAFAAGEGKKGDVGVESASEIGEDGGGFIVGMRGDVEDAGGDAGAVDGFDGFREARAGAGSGGKLRARTRGNQQAGYKNGQPSRQQNASHILLDNHLRMASQLADRLRVRQTAKDPFTRAQTI